jgi:hypothetical protein
VLPAVASKQHCRMLLGRDQNHSLISTERINKMNHNSIRQFLKHGGSCLYVITLGQRVADNINQMITITGHFH